MTKTKRPYVATKLGKAWIFPIMTEYFCVAIEFSRGWDFLSRQSWPGREVFYRDKKTLPYMTGLGVRRPCACDRPSQAFTTGMQRARQRRSTALSRGALPPKTESGARDRHLRTIELARPGLGIR